MKFTRAMLRSEKALSDDSSKKNTIKRAKQSSGGKGENICL